MKLWPQISRQRIKHIVNSYNLAGEEVESFSQELEVEVLPAYPTPAIELALVEVLAETWGHIPSPRGLIFLEKVKVRLKQWQETTVEIKITPAQFQQITGLDPDPVFGSPGSSPAYPVPPL